MKVEAYLINWLKFKSKDGRDFVALNILGADIPKEKGAGQYVFKTVVKPEIVSEGLKAGKVEIEKSEWSNYISGIKNI